MTESTEIAKIEIEVKAQSEAIKKGSEKEGPPMTFKEFHPVNPPFGYVGIKAEKETGRLLYLVIEPTMDEHEKQTLFRLKTILKEEANVPLAVLKDQPAIEGYLRKRIDRTIKSFKLDVSKESLEKFNYYVKRDFLGYGIIDVLIRDQNSEDISCNGTGIPIYVWHRFYESLPTNVAFGSREELDSFVTRLAYKAGHQISVSSPILEGSLDVGGSF